jgi:hypothetical protein
VSNLKELSKNFLSKIKDTFNNTKDAVITLKQKLVIAFNDVIDYFTQIFSQLIAIMFSFIGFNK